MALNLFCGCFSERKRSAGLNRTLPLRFLSPPGHGLSRGWTEYFNFLRFLCAIDFASHMSLFFF